MTDIDKNQGDKVMYGAALYWAKEKQRTPEQIALKIVEASNNAIELTLEAVSIEQRKTLAKHLMKDLGFK